MQPPAEHVHWLFATGFLLLGLCLLGEAIVGNGGVAAARRGALYLWPGLAFALGVLHVARDDVLHELGDPHARARGVGAGADARRARPSSRSSAGKLQSRWWRLAMTAALRRLRRARSSSTSRTRGCSSARRSCTTCSGWTLLVGAIFPLARAVRPRSQCAGDRLRARRSSSSRVMLYCDRDVAPIFGHISELAGTPHR